MGKLFLDQFNKIAFILLFFSILILTPNCKDPNVYKPQEDSLLPPPPPPELLTPPDSFVHIPRGSNRLFISWGIIEDADIYEIHFVDLNIMKEWTLKLDTNFLAQNWLGYYSRFTWCVRAYSPTWEYYTNWSTPRYFEVVNRPFDPPVLIYPPNDTVFYFDSFPGYINLVWAKYTKAQSYNCQVMCADILIYDVSTVDTNYVIEIDSATVYNWSVCAQNPLWEFPSYEAHRRFFVQLRQK